MAVKVLRIECSRYVVKVAALLNQPLGQVVCRIAFSISTFSDYRVSLGCGMVDLHKPPEHG
jgi:hypothetical protein